MRVTKKRVTKAVIPAAGFGTRFLPATKASPKEMLPLIDKPTIQYVIEEAVAAGIDDILIITGRTKRAIEDHFDRSLELEYALESAGKIEALEQMRSIADLADIHYIRQGEMKGLGHAVGMARKHVGDEPFAVMLGDIVMHESSTVLRDIIGACEETERSVIALMDVPREEISNYGCAAVEPVDGSLVKITDMVEKPAPEVAPSTLSVNGRYVLTPSVFEALDETPAGKGGEIQLTDALIKVMRTEGIFGWTFTKGCFDIGKKQDYLRATVELALEREDVGPEFREFLVEILKRQP